MIFKVQNCCDADAIEKPEPQSRLCPLCGQMGTGVGKHTVEHIVSAKFRPDIVGEAFWMCMNADCEIVYYSMEGGVQFTRKQVNVPIWFKKDAKPKYACYCAEVTKEEVVAAILEQGVRTVSEVNRVTGAMKNSNCKEKNPLGRCCHSVIQGIIEEALAGK